MNKLFTPSANNNFVIWIISYISLPVSKFFAHLKISPNLLTFLSLVLMICCCVFLINGNLILFIILFISSFILDICDGQVARILKKTNKTKFRFDHFTDIFKITIIYITFGILFNDLNSWIFIFISFTLFFFNDYIQVCLSNARKERNKLIKYKKKKFFFSNYFKLNFFVMIYKLLIPLIITFNSHSLLLILFVIIDIKIIYVIFLYYNFIFIFRILKNSRKLLILKK
jgi:phosphatidylglycerophosphate synthase